MIRSGCQRFPSFPISMTPLCLKGTKPTSLGIRLSDIKLFLFFEKESEMLGLGLGIRLEPNCSSVPTEIRFLKNRNRSVLLRNENRGNSVSVSSVRFPFDSGSNRTNRDLLLNKERKKNERRKTFIGEMGCCTLRRSHGRTMDPPPPHPPMAVAPSICRRRALP